MPASRVKLPTVKRILVVDDVAQVRRQIAAALTGLGAQVVEAGDGAEALAAICEAPAAVVVSDIRMPRIDGLGLLRALRTSDTPVILHSGYADVAAAIDGLRLGAVDFLPAPLDLGRLRARVEHCLHRHDLAGEVLVAQSAALQNIRRVISRICDAREPVLITGETGAGKEIVARAIHSASRRRAAPFIAVNMGALPDGTLESELFGHERGSFTGAVDRRKGRFEQAHGGTLLLDEIGDATPRVQLELLRIVETGSIERVGGSRPVAVDVRILAATHRDLPGEIARGRFREDLWYRLAALRIHVPPLRERRADIGPLVQHELELLSAERGTLAFEIDEEGAALLRAQPWPGNARELRLTVRRMAILAGERRFLDADDVRQALALNESIREASEAPARTEPTASRSDATPVSRADFDQREREDLLRLLGELRWNVSAAARNLGISRGSLRSRLRRLGLDGGDSTPR